MNNSVERTGNSWEIFENQREAKALVMSAYELQISGKFAEAETIYRKLLDEYGDQAGILNLLGTALHQQGKHENAVEYIQKALSLKANDDEILNNLGAAYRGQKKWEDAQNVLSLAVNFNRYNWQAHANLAKTEFELSHWADAIAAAKSALALSDVPKDMHKVLADCQRELREWKLAEESYRTYLKVYPNDAEAWNNLAFTLENLKRWEEALDLYKHAYDLRPDSYEIALNYGNILMFFKRYYEATEVYRKSLELNPQHVPTYTVIIQSLLYQFNLDRAYLYAKTMESLPGYDKKVMRAFRDRVSEYVFDFNESAQSSDEIFRAFEQVVPAIYGALFLNYIKYAKDDETTLKLSELVKEHGAYWKQLTDALEVKETLKPIPRRGKKIRLGLLSSDMRTHVVCKFLMPLILGHQKDMMEIRCYSPLKQIEDENQKIIRESVEEFHFVENMFHNELCDLIISQDNDILIDLNGYTADSRVGLMARKLAPVQMEWIGYPFTTGIAEIDYKIFDRYNAPELQGYGSEEPLIMPNSYVCYIMGKEPDFDPVPPFEKNGFITFGTFNNANKYTPTIIQSWARCMLAVPDSKFFIIRPESGSKILQANVRNEFAKYGVDPERIQFYSNPMGQHLPLYRALDVSLDVFPLTGGTTTCESMSMGVPVVTRYGAFHHSRLSRSFISNVGLPELCAPDEDGFVNIVANLCEDTKLLSWLHGNLRPIMQESILCNQKLFVEDFQTAMEAVVKKHGLR